MTLATRPAATYGRQARNRLAEATDPGPAGAHAALETFYHAFNTRSADVLTKVWLPDDLIRLSNPLGGIVEGIAGIVRLYDGIFTGPARVWVEFYDIVAYGLGPTGVVFAGRERGEFRKADATVELEIRTSRVFAYHDGRWGQLHHHGSITDPALLERYRAAVAG
ncbi:MAG: nuclear transport factor 2 family protein [Actinobacteria bacterium]|nr:nuclear transport factor 2 family protein [Actinomycetota bacterium]MBI3688478.1 nuclear transport factor 2 family protein [Actinomycetota bacterium]